MSLQQVRIEKANEIIRRIDTVTLLRCEEVDDLINRALAGEFDDMELEERKL
jgi:hypothetical protein